MTDSYERRYQPVTFPPEPPCQPGREPDGTGAPAVVRWCKVFCIGMGVLYLFLILTGVVMLIAPAWLSEEMAKTGSRANTQIDLAINMVMGGVYVVLGLLFSGVYFAGAFLPVRPWAWIGGIVLIAFSFTSCCCLPAAIPLLIYWMRPECKTYFHGG